MEHQPTSNCEHEIDLLRIKLNEMFSLSMEAFRASVTSLENMDLALARKTVNGDDEIDSLKRVIEEMAYEILEKFHLLSSDLRRIIMAIKISGELERIADQAVNIAQVSEFMNGRNLIKPLIDIPKMAQIAEKMIRDSMMAYFKEDVELAKKVWLMDDTVDALDKKLVEDIKSVILERDTEEVISQAERLILVSRAIERVADHATNICEETVYMILGKEMHKIL
ncbi:phosphate signaling complex protein PhoU [Mesoaciditoga lauensis]|uniref:phosphate signaling complex protein PhoU n=1 Tax=Mesoaciditoga lauensis TaxID=1495039 RepID=UPI000561142A|nr:phosphate signaling complex protein PhoU [Mesoaciditoga lauensis]